MQRGSCDGHCHMPRDSKYDVLFEPVQIGPKIMRNRFYQVAHSAGVGPDRPDSQAHFRAVRADGGWAVVSTGFCSISQECTPSDATIWDDGDVRNLARLCELAHERGALAATELFHGGLYGNDQESRIPMRGVSATPAANSAWQPPKEMDKRDIGEVQQLYVDAALRAREAGFDVVCVYAAHGATLLHQFLLPYYNRRFDEYGGSFEGRARFAREVLELIREAIGDDCAISCRFGVDTLDGPFGLGDRGVRQSEDGLRFVEHVDHLVDLWDINVSYGDAWGEDAGPSRTHPENHERQFVDRVKQHTDKPVLNVGRFTSPDTMVDAIRNGQCDIIGAARPSIADPFLPRKIEEGRLGDIRECIGCNVCVRTSRPRLFCTQNATAGEEHRRQWHPERFSTASNRDNDVLVIGSGAAGMECAIVLAKRGMRRVHLVDAASEVGGCMRWIPDLPGLGAWRRVVSWRQAQLAKLSNVEVITKLELDAQSTLDYGADIVVCATGSYWAPDGVQGITNAPIAGADSALPFVTTPEQVMVEDKAVGDKVVIYDCDHYFMAAGLAEKLARDGKDVTYVSPSMTVAALTQLTLEHGRLKRTLRRLGVTALLDHALTRIEEGAATVTAMETGDERRLSCDTVVLVTQRCPDDLLYRQLAAAPDALEAAGIKAVHRVGDCVTPTLIAGAVFSGHRLGREIDSANPDVPLPYLRERPLL
ncbi:MAG TPA: FAD-binding protein [Baekduia sp.]|nr:FAD-binding protein [Baekduia sp.]